MTPAYDWDQAFGNELIRLQPIVRRYVDSLCFDKDDAQDLAAIVLCKAWADRHSFRGEAKMETWVLQIARNNFLNYLRKRNNWSCVSSLEDLKPTASKTSDVCQIVATEITLQKVNEYIEREFTPTQKLLIKRCAQGMSYDEITEETGFTNSKIKSVICRARKKLAAEFLEYDI